MSALGRAPGAPAGAAVVVPTIGRPTLARTLAPVLAGAGTPGSPVTEVVVVDDRPRPAPPLDLGSVAAGAPVPVRVVTSGGRGPAAARNAGWRSTGAGWVAFLDDDVVPPPTWCADLGDDLDGLAPEIAATQGRITVPLPERPTDWERCTAGLEVACWATADMAYRRDVLEELGGFDERFERAFREDADLGLRTTAAGWIIVRGARGVEHPVRPAGPWVSVAAQRGNADDVLMGALHGAGWRTRCGAEPGRNGRHRATVAAAVTALAGAGARRPLPAAAGALGWAALTAAFAWDRIAPGPRTAREVATMVATSVAIPPAAVGHAVAGRARLRRLLADGARAPHGAPRPPLLAAGRNTPRPGLLVRPGRADPTFKPAAILFDRDGTLVIDVPYNSDPARVAPMPGARVALRRAREAGVRVGVVTNQSGVGSGRIRPDQLDAVNGRVEELLGPFDAWAVCPHRPGDGCACRKPAAGLVLQAAAELGVEPAECAVIGDIGSDLAAAAAAGARSVLVPTTATRREEVVAAGVVAPDLIRAVDFVLAGTC